MTEVTTPAPTVLPPYAKAVNHLGPFRPSCCRARRSFISACDGVEPRRGRLFHPTSQFTTATQSSSEREGQGATSSHSTIVVPSIPNQWHSGGEQTFYATRQNHDHIFAQKHFLNDGTSWPKIVGTPFFGVQNRMFAYLGHGTIRQPLHFQFPSGQFLGDLPTVQGLLKRGAWENKRCTSAVA